MAKLRSGTTIGGSTAWHAANDGSGSGLDADLLDGQQGSYYLNTSTSFGGDVSGTYNAIVIADDSHSHTNYLSNSTTSTQNGYFGNVYLYDDTNPSHYLAITNASDLSAARTLSVNVNNADRTISLSGNLTVSATASVSGTNTGDQTTITGNAGTATTLQTARTINGTSFNGSANITTASWGTARTLTVGGTGKSVSGSANVSWSITEVIPTSTNFQVNSLGVGTAASATAGEIRATNEITAFYSSDATLKENIRPIDSALDKVCAIGGKYFDWKDEYIEKRGGEDGYFVRKSDFGMIAQDVEKNFPVAVRKREDGTLALDYEKMCALAFEAIRELKEEIEKLKREA